MPSSGNSAKAGCEEGTDGMAEHGKKGPGFDRRLKIAVFLGNR